MEPTTLLFSPRMGGWLTRTSQYHSDWREAREFSLSSALAMCKNHKDSRGFGLIPIRLSDLEAI